MLNMDKRGYQSWTKKQSIIIGISQVIGVYWVTRKLGKSRQGKCFYNYSKTKSFPGVIREAAASSRNDE
ncbi:hypothetical protein JCM17380_26880 [Desulfosporosinus burensis]